MNNETPKYSTHSALNTLTTALFYISILFFIIGFNFSDTMVGNWYQQFMPNIGSRSIQDVFFLDSLTGWSVSNGTNQNPDTNYVLKTTNGGDNWTIHYRKLVTGGGFPGYTRVYFLNQNTGFASSVRGFDKTTDGGTSWTTLYSSESFQDMSILNTDTIWLASGNPLTGGVYRTTNGGSTWNNQLNIGSSNPNHIYMFNGRIGFICRDNVYLRKTTDSGLNWFTISGTGGFLDMHFADSLTGWKTSFQKTTDGGLTWINQSLPSGGNILTSQIVRFDNIVKDTIWGVGSTVLTGSGNRAMICRTTNGGNSWLFQVPDSNINIFQYQHVDFTSRFNGWAYTGSTGVHTTTGGDTTFYTPVNQISNHVPKDYVLFQNYPNPFNPVTKIKYQIVNSKYVKLIVYDIRGQEISTLVNRKQNAGTYEIDFDGRNYSSGIYFYSLFVEGKLVDTRKMALIK